MCRAMPDTMRAIWSTCPYPCWLSASCDLRYFIHSYLATSLWLKKSGTETHISVCEPVSFDRGHATNASYSMVLCSNARDGPLYLLSREASRVHSEWCSWPLLRQSISATHRWNTVRLLGTSEERGVAEVQPTLLRE